MINCISDEVGFEADKGYVILRHNTKGDCNWYTLDVEAARLLMEELRAAIEQAEAE